MLNVSPVLAVLPGIIAALVLLSFAVTAYCYTCTLDDGPPFLGAEKVAATENVPTYEPSSITTEGSLQVWGTLLVKSLVPQVDHVMVSRHVLARIFSQTIDELVTDLVACTVNEWDCEEGEQDWWTEKVEEDLALTIATEYNSGPVTGPPVVPSLMTSLVAP